MGYPAHQFVLDLLGEVLFGLGDLPAAGRYWYLTPRTGADVEAAAEALLQRFGRSPEELARHLPLVAPLDAYPALVVDRLRRLPQHALRIQPDPVSVDNRWRPLPLTAQAMNRGRSLARLGVTVGLCGLAVLGFVKLIKLALA